MIIDDHLRSPRLSSHFNSGTPPSRRREMASSSSTVTGDAASDVADNAYFAEYSDLSVQELMLKDSVRVTAYRDAVRDNSHLFEGKTVMDVGAGVGVLSLFCARAGAKRVYAVEGSGAAMVAERVVAKNGMKEVVKVVHRRVEDINDMDDVEVDVIISEWMGFYLLHESMLDTVIFARDKWLKPEGLLFPSFAYLLLAPVDMSVNLAETAAAWTDFHGFDLSPVGAALDARRAAKPAVLDVSESQLLADPRTLASFDLKTVSSDEAAAVFQALTFDVDLGESSKPSKSSSSSTRPFHGFACWFDVVFAGDPSARPITLTTRPGAPSTHWKQTVFFLPRASEVRHDDVVSCYATLTRDLDNPRRYDVCIDLRRDGVEDEEEGDIDMEGKDHPLPCDCGAARCALIKAVLEKYAREETERLEAEAELHE